MLDPTFSSLAEALGDTDGPLESIAVPRLLAVAYAVGWSGKMLSVNPINFAGELEGAIDARGGLQDIGSVADANLATAQSAASNQIQHDAIALYVSMYGPIDPFADRGVTALPEVDDGHVDCSSSRAWRSWRGGAAKSPMRRCGRWQDAFALGCRCRPTSRMRRR